MQTNSNVFNGTPFRLLRYLIKTSLFCLILESSTAHAQNDALVQVGTWRCTWYGVYNTYLKCDDVKFQRPFASTPNVVVSVSGQVPGGFQHPDPDYNLNEQVIHPDYIPYPRAFATSVTPSGFVPSVISGHPPAPYDNSEAYGSWVAVGQLSISNPVTPNYLVLTIIYAPPGTNGGRGSSSVSYQAGSTTGSSVSSSKTFKSTNSISAEGSGGIIGNGGGAGIAFEYSRSVTDSQSLDVKKSVTASISRAGPGKDGIDHDEDEIWLALRPAVALNLTTSSASWMLLDNQVVVQYVNVGWLNGHQPMPDGVAKQLKAAGITSSDYRDILARDPLADGQSSPPDPNRYVLINATYPYEPPYSANDPVPIQTFSISDSSLTSFGSDISETYKVGLTVSGSGGFLGFAKATLKDTASWEWTTKSSQTKSNGSSQTASLAVGGPAYGYAGNTLLLAYLDKLYGTFAFALADVADYKVRLKGSLKRQNRDPLPWTEVRVSVNGVSHRTVTNAKGEFIVLGEVDGPVELEASGVIQKIHFDHSTSPSSIEVMLTQQ